MYMYVASRLLSCVRAHVLSLNGILTVDLIRILFVNYSLTRHFDRMHDSNFGFLYNFFTDTRFVTCTMLSFQKVFKTNLLAPKTLKLWYVLQLYILHS